MVIGISSFDCLSSLAYALVGIMAPSDAGFYGSRGNETTCVIQGFMIQLGLTSIFYNLCLSIYFYLVIRHNWKERQFQKHLRYIHIVLVFIGFTLACAAIPHYGAQFGTCYLVSHEILEKQRTLCISHLRAKTSLMHRSSQSHGPS